MKRIAIVGSGISGLTAGYLLSQKHHVTLFEAGDYLGGHTATVDVDINHKSYAVDTGFIVFNNRTYPNFLKLLKQIGLDKQETEMSFSIQHGQSGLEYNGHSLSTLFAQKRNLLKPGFYKFLFEIMRFNKLALAAIAEGEINKPEAERQTLGDFLTRHKLSDYFAEHYILPMVAAIWSSSLDDAREFPLAFFLRFFDHHGLLTINDRPQWYVIPGGSRSYIPHLTQPIQAIRLQTPVERIDRTMHGVVLHTPEQAEHFDEVILACHSDQALKLLSDPTEREQQVLGQLAYRDNEVVLHTDRSLLPKRRRAWASWNYFLDGKPGALPSVTYNMNILQGIQSDESLCVTLNRTADINPQKILRKFTYAHPVYNQQAIEAQAQRTQICGVRHTHFCGAYWYNGFHEDGVRSALDVCKRFEITLEDLPQAEPRPGENQTVSPLGTSAAPSSTAIGTA